MITINWSCGYGAGYGDIISPLCYAQNQSEIKDDMVTLIMNWRFSKNQSNETSPDAKVEFIVRNFDFSGLRIINKYDQQYHKKNLNEELKVINTLDPMHNVYFPIPYTAINPKHTVVCSTINNVDSFDTYADGKRKWKDALTREQWMNIINQPDTTHIDYRTPIHETIKALYECKIFVGYHGSCAWLARMMGVPLKIYTNNPKLTDYCFPWSLDQKKPNDYDLGLIKVDHYRTIRNEYVDNLRGARFKRTTSV